MKRIEDLGSKEVIHCETEYEAKLLCAILHSMGKKWWNGYSYLDDTNWAYYKKDTCYNVNGGGYCNTSRYKKEGYTIHKASDILPQWGEEVEVRSTSEVWKKRTFIGLNPTGKVELFVTSNENGISYEWTKIRPVQEEERLDIKITVNGVEKSPSDFSEESWNSLRK